MPLQVTQTQELDPVLHLPIVASDHYDCILTPTHVIKVYARKAALWLSQFDIGSVDPDLVYRVENLNSVYPLGIAVLSSNTENARDGYSTWIKLKLWNNN